MFPSHVWLLEYDSLDFCLTQPGLGAIGPRGRLLRHLCPQGYPMLANQPAFEVKHARKVSCPVMTDDADDDDDDDDEETY